MTNRIELHNVPSKGLANVLTCLEMPDDPEVTERTQATRRIGAFNMLVHLATGEWSIGSHPEMAEYLGRVLANAERQGLEIPPPIPGLE